MLQIIDKSKIGHKIKRLRRHAKALIQKRPDDFLNQMKGVIHIGANTGQERTKYAKRGLPVVWIEPQPSAFGQLVENIKPYRDQIAIQALLTDKDGDECTFHISNDDRFSSILDYAKHTLIQPNIHHVEDIRLISSTLPKLLIKHAVNIESYDALLMDTQGSELLILQGAESILHNFKYIKTEAADYEAYAGCAKAHEIDSFLSERGFRAVRYDEICKDKAGGTYYDILFKHI